MGSQFSFFGWKKSPYLSMTSGLSSISLTHWSTSATRSAAAWQDWNSEKIPAKFRMGSNIMPPILMKKFRVPMVRTPRCTSWPPAMRMHPVARLITRLARGMYTAEMVAERMEALNISWVSRANSRSFSSSRFRVLLVRAPMIPSLKEEVIMLLSLLVFR